MVRSKETERLNKDPYHHGALAKAALDAAIAQIEKEGAAALSLRKVASAASVSHTALYRHFANRDELLTAVKVEAFAALLDRLVAAEDDKELFCRQYVRFAVARPRLYELMMATPMGAMSNPLVGKINSVIGAARTAFSSDDDIKQTWMLLHGGLSLHASGVMAGRTAQELEDFLVSSALRTY